MNKIVNLLTNRFFNRNQYMLPSPTKVEILLIDELKNVGRSYSHFSDPALESSDAGKEWLQNLQKLSQEIVRGDPRLFLNWAVIQNTMFVSNASYTAKELKFIKRQADWKTRWKDAIIESPFGSPSRYDRYPVSSGNLIHHAYQIAAFESITHKTVDKLDFVLEFGGGYGSMCRLFNNLGFRGTYIIYDLPIFSALQAYYLKSIGLEVDNAIESDMKIVCVSDFDQLKSLLKTTFKDKSLFLATWSLSEAPLSVRARFLDIARKFNYFLFSFQEQFGEVNNLDYFKQFAQSTNNHVRWTSDAYEYIPGNYYLIGQTI